MLHKQLLHTSGWLLIRTLPPLPPVVSTTICRALKRTWLDKWPGLNINHSHSLIYRVIFQPYQLLIQMTTWALVWGGCEVGKETPVRCLQMLLVLWMASTNCENAPSCQTWTFSFLPSVSLIWSVLQPVSWFYSWRGWDGTACETVWKIRQDPMCWSPVCELGEQHCISC